MTAKYAEREYRIYGHKCTRRRYIAECIRAACYCVGGTAYAVFELRAEFSPDRLVLFATAVLMFCVANRIKAMNINGYDDEKSTEKDLPRLFTWRDGS